MKVLVLRSFKNLGSVGSVVAVKAGYARKAGSARKSGSV